MNVIKTAPRRGRPTAQHAEEKLAQVLTVARDQFMNLGYRAVTMRGVAEAAQVSTRTLYNRYQDKLSLFSACLDSGATAFPNIAHLAGEELAAVLSRYAAALVRALSTNLSLRLGMLVYREGAEFPELVSAAEANQDRYLVQPLAAYLRAAQLSDGDEVERAKLFIALAISEWQRRVSFRRPPQGEKEIDRHAAFVVRIFLDGARTTARSR